MKRIFLYLFTILSAFLFSCSLPKKTVNTQFYRNMAPYLYYYEGVQNRLYGNINQAIANLDKSLKYNPNNAAVHYELALCYSSIEYYNNAITHLKRAIDIDSTNIYYRDYISLLYLNLNKIPEALDNQKVLVSLDSTNSNYKHRLALLYTEIADYPKSLQIVNELENTYGFSETLAELKTRIYFEVKDYDNAEIEINNLLSINPTNPVYYLYKSDLFYRMGDDSLSLVHINRAIEINPNFPFSYIELFKKSIQMGDITTSLSALNEVFTNNNINPTQKVQLFYPLMLDRNVLNSHIPKLDFLVDTLISLHSKDQIVLDLAYEYFVRVQKFENARNILLDLIDLDSSNPQRYDTQIIFEYSLRNVDEALLYAKKASKLFPNYYNFYLIQTIIYQEKRDLNTAIIVLKNGIKNLASSNDKSELYGVLGDLYYGLHDIKRSFKSYEKSLKYNSSNARILNNYSYYLALRQEKLNKALDMSTKAVNLEPNSSTYIDTKGWVLFNLKRYEESREVLRNAIAKSGSESAVINEHYGDALYKTGNKDNAYVYWLKAKEIGGGSLQLEEKLKTRTYVPH